MDNVPGEVIDWFYVLIDNDVRMYKMIQQTNVIVIGIEVY